MNSIVPTDLDSPTSVRVATAQLPSFFVDLDWEIKQLDSREECRVMKSFSSSEKR